MLGEHRVLVDDVEEGRREVNVAAGSRARVGGEVEAEAVDVHLGHPVPEAVGHELQGLRVPQVERVAAAGEVHVERGSPLRRR